jgi:hypothetical protein
MARWGRNGRFVRRAVSVLGAALLVTGIGAAPSAAYQQTTASGSRGLYVVNDVNGTPGVTCTMQAASGVNNDNLASITVRGFYAHGTGASMRKVGYRFLVSRKAASASAYTTIYTSPIKKQSATSTTPTFFADRTRTFAAPVPNDGARYRVQIRLFWYAADGVTVVGKAGGLIEIYNHAMTGTTSYPIGSEGSAGYCKANYHF